MKRSQLVIPWKNGLHLRPAAHLVRLAQRSNSAIWLKVGPRVANARSIMAILLLCAAAGTVVDLEIDGEDEETVLGHIHHVFQEDDDETGKG